MVKQNYFLARIDGNAPFIDSGYLKRRYLSFDDAVSDMVRYLDEKILSHCKTFGSSIVLEKEYLRKGESYRRQYVILSNSDYIHLVTLYISSEVIIFR